MSFKINGIPVNVTMFPDKTSQVWKLPKELDTALELDIVWVFEHEGEIMHLAQICDLFRGTAKSLYMSYLPYARQDKRISNETTFALCTFASIINDMGFYKVSALDPHSKEAEYHINNFESVLPDKLIENAYKLSESEVICYPDFGAASRYKLGYKQEVIIRKTRDQQTGQILKTELSSQYREIVKDKKVLIVDDICDGGRTFIEAAKLLYDAGAKQVNLYITHGIFSKGLQILENAKIYHIYTKNGEAFEIQGNIAYKEYEK